MIRGRRLGPITGGTCIVHPGTSRSRAPCDRLTVTAYTMNVMAEVWGIIIVGETTVVTPKHVAPDCPVTEPLSQHCAAPGTLQVAR